MNLIQNREPTTQKVNAQYPCLATNLGRDAIGFHINLDESYPKALVYEFDDNYEKGETFVDFVNLNDFKELGLEEQFINIDTCARFVYLTRSLKQFQDNARKRELELK